MSEDPIEQNEQEGVFLCGRATKPGRLEDGSYCDTSDSELEFNKDGYKRSKTKSFKKKANATDRDSDEFELSPDADTVLSEMESDDDEEMIELKRKKNSNMVSLTHTVGTGAGVTFFCNVGFQPISQLSFFTTTGPHPPPAPAPANADARAHRASDFGRY